MANFPGRRNSISDTSINSPIWSPYQAKRRLSIDCDNKASALQFPTFANVARTISFEDEASFDEPDFSESCRTEDDNFDEGFSFTEPQKKARSPSVTRTRRRGSLTEGHDQKKKERVHKELVSPTARAPIRQKKKVSSDVFNPFDMAKETLMQTTSHVHSPKLSPKRDGAGKRRIALKVRASDLSESKRKEIESLFRLLQTEVPDSVRQIEKQTEKHRKRPSSVGRKRSSDTERHRVESSSSRKTSSHRGRSVDRSSKDGKQKDRSRSRQKKSTEEHKEEDRKERKHNRDEVKTSRSRSSTRRSTKEHERSRSRGSERERPSSRTASPKKTLKPESFSSETNFDTLKESLDLLKSTLAGFDR